MVLEDVVLLLVAGGLLAYLVVTLLWPEKF
jgi:K+-transporting ATPase KdpF subunit